MPPFVPLLGPVFPLLLATGFVVSALWLVAVRWAVFDHARQARSHASVPASVPGRRTKISLLVPLCGAPPGLYDDLARLCRQSVMPAEILFGVADPEDAAASVVERLQAAFPDVTVRIFSGPVPRAGNPKVANLCQLAPHARGGWLVLVDSDVVVPPDHLARLTAPLADPSVGAVTCLYRAVPEGGLPALVNALCVNTDFVPSALAATCLEPLRHAFGASIALRREVLGEIGGFERLADHLADDHVLGALVASRNYRIVLAEHWVDTRLRTPDWRSLWHHQVRWSRTTRSARPLGYLGFGLTHATPWALLLAVAYGGHPLCLPLAAALLAGRLLVARGVLRTHGLPAGWREMVALLPRDLFALAVWMAAFTGRHVTWNRRRFRLLRGGRIREVKEARCAASPPAPPGQGSSY